MTKDSEVFKLANSYLNIRMLGIFSIGITYSFRGYWNATSRPTLFLYTSILTYLLNFIISFISSKKIGLAGVALGSVLSTVFSVFLNLSLLNYFYKLKWIRINFSNLKSILGQAIPTGLQHFFFALSYVLFFAIIGRIGPNELAAANVLITITLFLIYPAMGIGMTTAYFINKSNSNPLLLNSEFWIKKILIYSVFLFLLTSIPLMFFYKQILSFFIHDQKIFEIAKIPYIYFLATLTFEVIGHIYSYALFNVKKSFEVLVVSLFIQWPGILLFSYLFGTNFQNIWNIQISFRILQSVIFFLLWKKHLKKSNFIQ